MSAQSTDQRGDLPLCRRCGNQIQTGNTVYCSLDCRNSPPKCVACDNRASRKKTGRGFLVTCGSALCVAKRKREASKRLAICRNEDERQLRNRRRVKMIVLDHYSNGEMKCSCCGEKYIEFLTIDHIEGGGAIHRRSIGNGKIGTGGGAFYGWLRSQGFPAGYRVLCQNCNFAIGVFGYCPHQVASQYGSPLEMFVGQSGVRLLDRHHTTPSERHVEIVGGR